MSSRLWIGVVAAAVAGMLLVGGAYHFLWPHKRSIESVERVPATTTSGEAKRSPLEAAPAPAVVPTEHAQATPAPAVPAVEQTPQSLAEMIASLATQPNGLVRVLKVKHDGGAGCHGTLVFTFEDFRFECPGEAGETIRIARGEVGKVHKNGVQVWKPGGGRKLGRKYHFSMTGRGKDLVEDVFEEWMRLRRS